MQKLNVKILSIDHVVCAVKTDEYDWITDEELYNEACNCCFNEETASEYY